MIRFFPEASFTRDAAGVHFTIAELAPLALRTGVPTAVFILSAITVLPSASVNAVLASLLLGILYSGTGIEIKVAGGRGVFLATTWAGIAIGAILGSCSSLAVLALRRKAPTKPAQKSRLRPSVSDL